VSDQPSQHATTQPNAAAAVATTEAPQSGGSVQSAASLQPTGAKSGGYYWGTGRRKTSIARVRIRPGSGKFLIHGKEIDHYLFNERDRSDVVAPLKATGTLGKFDVYVRVHGGGPTGQSGAILLGVARALVKADPNLMDILRDRNYLTRDDRKVERKKYGQPGARKRFQFSKR